MTRTPLAGLLCWVLGSPAAFAGVEAEREFKVASADGTPITGQVDLPPKPTALAVIMVAGTGLFDRDARFGRSGTPRDRLFKDLAERITARGGMAVRYDKRGVGYTGGGPVARTPSILATTTTTTSREDLQAVYDWTRSPAGLGARCVVLFAHSEGMIHVGRLAAAGAPAPRLVVGMGAAMQSPVADVRWQQTERDAVSLEMMDADNDGVTTNEEVEANWRRTPSAFSEDLGPFLNPNGRWTRVDLDQLRRRQIARYESQRAAALAQPDGAPNPNASAPWSSYQWWKSWFLDDTAVARNLSDWNTRYQLHYGVYDSQTPPEAEIRAARAFLPAGSLTVVMHPGGHSLGKHPLYGPLDEKAADRIAQDAVAACAR